MKLKRVTFQLTEEQYEYLRTMAFENRTTISALIRRAVDQYIDHVEKREQELKQLPG